MFDDILDWPKTSEEEVELSEEEMKFLAERIYEGIEDEDDEEECDCKGSCSGCGHALR